MTRAASFGGRIIIFGYGTIGRCVLPMLLRAFDLPLARYCVVDALDRRDQLASYLAEGLAFLQRRASLDTLDALVGEIAAAGDLLLNLSVGVDSIDLADACQRQGVTYVDTALEPWEAVLLDPAQEPPNERTEYFFQNRVRKLAAKSWRADGPTVVVTHGANPGIVSHFTKAALLDVATAMGLAFDPPASRRDWARLAQMTGTKVIHISERDTQVSERPKEPGEFVNTWSIPGFVEEAMMPFEVAWGTHEKRLPPGALRHLEGPGSAIYVPQPAAHYLLRSWVPLGGPINGLAIPHNEMITIADHLTLEEEGEVVYRPSVSFVYLASDAAMASLHETMMNGWQMQSRQRIMNEDILAGRDELGVLLLGHGLTGWWWGSQLDIVEARSVLPGHNPTAIQVAAGVLGAAVWVARNPAAGYHEPEDLPHEEILEIALPYLGTMVSQACDWTPLKGRGAVFDEPWCDPGDPWQFGNFLVGPRF
jgi:homospermidine synthase